MLREFLFNQRRVFTRQNLLNTFSNEQEIRETYLEPFEHAVVEGGARNVMNSFGRVGVVWMGAHEGIMTNSSAK